MKTRTLLLLALAIFAFTACKKEKTEEPAPVSPGQARFTVSQLSYTQDSIWNTALLSFTADTLTYATAWHTPNDLNNLELVVGISKVVPGGGQLSPAEIWALYEPGEKPFARNGVQAEGAVVEWRGLEGALPLDYYSSAKGLQTNSKFVITHRDDMRDDRTYFFASGTFTCTVYDGGQHIPKEITGEWNGVISLF